MATTSDPHSVEFEAHRAALEGLAYRMLGTSGDVQDIVQETWFRWRRAPEVDSPRAWLMRACSRICIDHLKSARARRERYVGPWLPEPLVGAAASPEERLELDESLSMAMFVLLERLTPLERAAFLLHDVFDYDFDDVALILEKNPAACRKLVSRARAHLRARRPRAELDVEAWQRMTDAFVEATKSGDVERLERLLVADATLRSDGGGKATAAVNVLEGSSRVARFLVGTLGKALAAGAELQHTWFNGAPGLLVLDRGRAVTAIQLAWSDAGVAEICVVRNPDKLAVFEGEGETQERTEAPWSSI